MKNGETVAAFEKAFCEFVGAGFGIALANGTCTLHAALLALGVEPGDVVSVPPLTMASTTIAVLHAGAIPQFVDVDPDTWLMQRKSCDYAIPVSLFGLRPLYTISDHSVDDAAQTLRRHGPSAFTSYSFQSSKIISTGEGGMLVTDSPELATRARELSSLGYRMEATQPRIDSAVLKSPTFNRHHSIGFNYRMNDLTAAEGLKQLARANELLSERRQSADFYRQAMEGCAWIRPQLTPEGWEHDYWCYAIALESKELWHPFVEAIERHGGERPYSCWRLTYQEPAFKHLAPGGPCPNAEDLQPRLVQFQTNTIASAEKNAQALSRAIKELN